MDILRKANQSLREFLARNAAASPGSDEDVRAMVRMEQTLRAVGVELDRLQASDDVEVRVELGLYRDHLLRLRQQLGVLQKSATECQARLFVREKHLRAAQAWCASARATG